MIKLNNFLNNENIKVIDEKGGIKVLEYQTDLSVTYQNAVQEYYASKMNVRKRQVFIELKNDAYTISAGAMQWMAGGIQATSGIKGVGDMLGKMFSSAVTKESAVKPEYKGSGYLMLEPTYKHIVLLDVAQWNGGVSIEDGMFLACESTVKQSVVARSTFSSAVAGGEGLFNLSLSGNGIAVLESNIPKEELMEIELDNDEIKIDGSMAVAWSNSLKFTVEKSTKSLLGSAVSGEGLVNVYRGTGKILMAPVL